MVVTGMVWKCGREGDSLHTDSDTDNREKRTIFKLPPPSPPPLLTTPPSPDDPAAGVDVLPGKPDGGGYHVGNQRDE